MKIFITGGTGFIGKHVVRKLLEDRNNEILVLIMSRDEVLPANENIKSIEGNLLNISVWKEQLKNFNPDVAIHLAWEGIPDHGHEISMKNLNYGLDLFLLLKEIGCKKVVCSGSCWEYGKKLGLLNEEMPSCSTDPFTAAKIALFHMGKDIFKDSDTKFIWTRFFYVYGPGQRKESLIPHILSSIKERRNPEIRTPDSRNDFVYVKDVADAVCGLATKNAEGGIYNVGFGESNSIKEIIKLVNGKMVSQNPETIQSYEQEKIDFWADISKIKEEIGWEPKIGIREGVKELIASYE